jgi:oligopeptide transport system substrate-binding protein
MSKKLYLVAALAVVGGLLAGCGGGEVQTVVITSPPEEIVVEQTVEVQVEVPQEGPMCTYNAYRMGWVMDYADPENMVNVVFHPDSPFQYTFWDDANFRDLVDQAMAELDVDLRIPLWQQAEDILMNDYVITLPLFHYDRSTLLSTDVTAEFSPFGSPHFAHWAVEGRDTLIVQLGTEPPTLDVNQGTDTTSHLVLAQLMEAPYYYDGTGAIQPGGATSYDVSDDGTVYTVYLREDAAWSDGEPVVAQHYVDGIIRLLEPATAAEYAYNMYVISGAEAFNTGETDDPATVGVSATDDYTLVFTLDSPQSFFDSLLAFSTMYPVRLDVIEQYGDQWTEPGNFVGNGPYVLVEWAHEDHVTIEKNPNWHSADEVTIERVEYPIIVEAATALAAFERGELDWSGYPTEELPRILEEMPENFQRLPRPGTYYVGYNLNLAPTDNLNLRKALSSAVDRRAILDNVLEMPWRIEACGVIPPEILGFQGCGNVGWDYDLDAAAEYLEAAMAEMGMEAAEDIVVQLWFNRGNEETIEAVEQQWTANLGIQVTVVNMEWGVYLDTLDICNN